MEEINHRPGIDAHLDQYLKNSLLRNLFAWLKTYIEVDSMFLFNFIECLGFGPGRVVSFVLSLVLCAFRGYLCMFYLLWCILVYIQSLLIKKKSHSILIPK